MFKLLIFRFNYNLYFKSFINNNNNKNKNGNNNKY